MEKLTDFLSHNETFIMLQELSKTSNYPIDAHVIAKNNSTLTEFAQQYVKCQPGPLYKCQQIVKGMQISLNYRDGKFYITYANCAHYEYDNRNLRIKSQYLYCDFDVDIFPNTIKGYLEKIKQENIFNDEEKQERKLLIKSAGALIVKYLNNKTVPIKGYFIWGKPGIGKTHMLRALANEAANRHAKVVFCTAPSIIEKVKEQFGDQEKEQKRITRHLKECDVLFIDDFGGEMVSPWSRDNFWFTIFNTRMDHNKLTFFSSNFWLNELDNLYSIKGNIKAMELKKVERLKERIRALVSFYNLKGEKSKRNLD